MNTQNNATMVLSTEQIELISKTAALVAIEQLKKEQEQVQKQQHDRRLRNVKLLLRNYQTFVMHVSDVKRDIVRLGKQLALDELDTDEFAVQAIKRSKERTLMLVEFIERMLKVYEVVCDQSSNPEEQRRYSTIYNLYIAKEKKDLEQISDMLFVSERTVMRDLKKAYEDLTVLIFGVDGLRFQ